MEPLTLRALPCGGHAVVCGIDPENPLKTRLTDLGLTAGVPVQCLFAAPVGEPRAFLVRDTILALRASEAASVRILAADSEVAAWV